MAETLVDNSGNALNERNSFYKIHPYTTPHAFIGLDHEGSHARFVNYSGETACVPIAEVAKDVKPFPPEELVDLLEDDGRSEDVSRILKKISNFVSEKCAEWRE
jgi:hypothetical protein